MDSIDATFIAAAIALLSVPGPSVIYVITRGSAGGRRAGLLAALGNTLGVLAISALVVFGLSALLRLAPIAFAVLKWLGVAYLVYLGLRMLRDTSAVLMSGSTSATSRDAGQIVFQGTITTMLNPKMLVIYPAFLPQFVRGDAGDLTAQLLGLGGTFSVLSLAVYLVYALLAALLGGLLRRSTTAATVLRWLSGLTFIGLGARLALDSHT